MTTTLRKLSVLTSFIVLCLTSGLLHAQQTETPPTSAETEEIVKQVIEELRDSGLLQEAVQEGIQEFILKQQAAQAQARERQEEMLNERAKDVRPVTMERDHVYGNPEAVVSLIEYSDFECPYCKRFHPTVKELLDQYDGKVNWVYRHFPLGFHNPGAQKQAEASECAAELGGNDAFWAYTDAIYERTRSGGEGFPLAQLAPLAAELGMDEGAFKECLDSDRHEDRVNEDMQEGIRIGISGTPGNVLLHNETGDALMRSGAQPLGNLTEAVEQLLNGADSG
jgi:protein-disulfide isomerase